MARPRHRQSSCRIEFSDQNIGNCMPRFAAKKPRGENSVRAFEEPGRGERAAGREKRDDRLAKVQNRLGERALASRQAEISPTCRLSTHPCDLSETDPNQFSLT